LRRYEAPGGPGQEREADLLEADLRAAVAERGDFDVPSAIREAGDGPELELVKASRILEEIDADREFLEQVKLCLK
jgi:hypothetical protein